MTWTRFMDMHSGGGQKEDFAYCYIEAPEDEAKSVFYARFGHNPDRITCTCCGSDYSIDSDDESLDEATAYERGAAEWSWNKKNIPLDQWLASSEAHVIYAADIQPDERTASVPNQGYVWQD